MGMPFLSYGFRPFFLLAALQAIGTLAVLAAALLRGAWPAGAPPPGRWHGHEMLFGFVAAAIAGFLLTAVPTWTNRRPVSGWPLAALAALWLAGRIAMLPWLGLLDTPLVLVDALFFPALGVALGASLVPARNYRNWPFLGILALLTVADLVFLAVMSGGLAPPPFDPLLLVANLVTLLIALVGGRIVPLFTRNALARGGVAIEIPQRPWLERTVFAALIGVLLVDLVRPNGTAAGALAAAAAVLLAARLAHWHGHRTLAMPIVWVLHAGYGWLVAAFALKAAFLLGGATWAAQWLHALTAGAFGTMALGVMTRVALGHTGRPLRVAKPIAAAYVLVICGALLRVAGPALFPAKTLSVLTAAMSVWGAAFAIFIAVYLPILLGPRADGA
ncbi:MAG TPA: NnrS family protein [Gammaproteobacteria bacterium]|nr:NnrS family protein [Gammaproteobacteria bacterium]